VCDYSTYDRQTLEIHSNCVHLGKKDYKCDHCDKSFSVKRSLVVHVNRIHTKMKSYSCELCSYTSYAKSDLKVHSIRRHAGNNPSLSDLIKEAQKDQMIVSVEKITVVE
jgi:uncharacterized C2H2 Zn-finger protein